MNILSAEDKPVCSEGVQARPRIQSARTQGLDSQPHSSCITLSPPLTHGELLTGIRRLWSHDLDLANRCAPSSLATVIG